MYNYKSLQLLLLIKRDPDSVNSPPPTKRIEQVEFTKRRRRNQISDVDLISLCASTLTFHVINEEQYVLRVFPMWVPTIFQITISPVQKPGERELFFKYHPIQDTNKINNDIFFVNSGDHRQRVQRKWLTYNEKLHEVYRSINAIHHWQE